MGFVGRLFRGLIGGLQSAKQHESTGHDGAA
jgi:hypothetical protein